MKRLPQLGMSIALFAALIASTGSTVHTYKLAISKAE